MEKPSFGPLAGTRVIDLGIMFAGPFVASLLGDFGADVIKVELPGAGDPNRAITPIVKGVPGTWTIISRNKRSISLDIRKERGREILMRLAATADIVVENFRPGTLEGWGLGYETFERANPRIILVRVSGYGQTGSYRNRVGLATPAAGFSGVTYLQGHPDRPPVAPPFAFVDYMAGSYGAMAAAMALAHLRGDPEARGQQIDVALYEPLFRMLEPMVAEYGLAGRVRERPGHTLQESAPAGTFQCKEGRFISLGTASDRLFYRLAEVMGRGDLAKDPRFDTVAHRSEHAEEITAIVQEWFSRHTVEEAVALLDRAGVPVDPINSMADVFGDPRFRERETLVEVEHPILGKVPMPGIVPKLSGTPGSIRFPGPVAVGEHNEAIYQGELGMSHGELERLRAEGVI